MLGGERKTRMTYGGATLRERQTIIRDRPGGILTKPFPRFGQKASTVGIQKSGVRGRMGNFAGGVGSGRRRQKLAETLTPELIAMRFRKTRVLIHKDIPKPKNNLCEDSIVSHGVGHDGAGWRSR